MSSSSRSTFLLLISLTLLLHSQSLPKTAFSKNLVFNFPPFSTETLLLGNSVILNNSLCLIKTTNNHQSPTFGAVVFLHPIAISPLFSFTTTFSFSTTNPDDQDPIFPNNNAITFFLLPNISTNPLFLSPQTLIHNSLFSFQFPISNPHKKANFTLTTATISINFKKGRILATVSMGNPHSLITIKQETLNFIPNQIYPGFLSTNNNNSSSHTIQSWVLSSQTPRRINLQSTKSPTPHLHILLRATILASSFAVIALLGFNLKRHLTKTEQQKNQSIPKNLPKFKYSDIVSATNNFSHLVGRGGTARVYKMNFPPSSPFFYAVKRFTKHQESIKCFHDELETITRVRHVNILALKGLSEDSSGERILVYDYMSRGSLHQVLHSEENPIFGWTQRYQTAVKLAIALKHLHKECCPPIVHGDVKCRNIMVTDEGEPKLGDFGMARVGWRLKKEKSNFDEKVDVGQYGKVVIEICTGKMPGEMAVGFVEIVREMEGEGRLVEAADARLGGCFEGEEMVRLLRLGLVCCCGDIERRPSMEWVLKVLNGELEIGERSERGGRMVECSGKGKEKMML